MPPVEQHNELRSTRTESEYPSHFVAKSMRGVVDEDRSIFFCVAVFSKMWQMCPRSLSTWTCSVWLDRGFPQPIHD